MATATRELPSTVLQWPTPRIVQANPELDPVAFLSRLHRGDGAAVALTRKNPLLINERNSEGWENLGTIRVSEFGSSLDTIRQAISKDAFWTINSIYLSDSFVGGGPSPVTGLTRTRRTTKDLKYLNALYVDLDGREVGLTAEQSYSGAIAHLLELDLPLPSISLWSGQGCWLFWPFDAPVKAFADSTCVFLSRINENLIARFKHLGADSHSKDAARVCRIPGSINPKSNTAVFWREIEGGSTVRLEEFASVLGVPSHKTAITREESAKQVSHTKQQSRVDRGRKRWQTRRTDILQVIESRGIPEGLRYDTFFYLAAISKRCGIKAGDVRAEALEFNQTHCNPPHPDSKVIMAVAGGLSTSKHIADLTLINALKITPEECTRLKLYVGRPKKAKRPRRKKVEVAERRKMIRDLQGVSIRDMVDKLAARGFTVSRETIRRDLSAMMKGKTIQ